jgi:DNA modification methylase
MRLETVPIDSIEAGERFRKEFGNVEELARDISTKGLISPLAVLDKGDGGFLLLAGERRLNALLHNKATEVPVRIYEEGLSDFEIRAIELSENFHRKDLEWHEYVKLTQEIHRLQQDIHGEKISTAPDAEGWGTRDTASLTGRSQSGVAQDLRIAEAYEAVPELFSKCKTKQEAAKVISKLDEEMVRRELAKRVASAPSESVKKRLMDSFIVKDCFEGMKEVPSGSINLVEIDPPYAIDLEKTKKEYTYGDSYNEVRSSDYPKFLRRLFAESYRCMAEHSWIIVWFAHDPWFEPVYKLLQETGFEGSRMVGIWKKPTGQSQQPQYNLANTTEFFFYARKGQPAIGTPGRANVFEANPVPASQKVHPTERPVELARELLATFGFEGHRVMVPCCGSGNTLIAAHELGMTPFGFELSGQFKDSFVIKVHKL